MTTALTRLPLVDPATATGPAKTLLDGIAKSVGFVPNFLQAVASSPAALGAYLNYDGKLQTGALDKQIAERIALVLAETNGCQYCVSAHTVMGENAGLSEEEILAARKGASSEAKADAAVRFAKSVVENRGDVTTGELQELREAGFGDGEVIEIVAHIALHTFTNYVGKIGQIDIDFPEVALLGSEG
jgi:uncharacterized peroxidase-related enzyme